MNLGPAEILVILVVALVVFGPKRLPEVGRQVGKAVRELRKMQDTVKGELEHVMHHDVTGDSSASEVSSSDSLSAVESSAIEAEGREEGDHSLPNSSLPNSSEPNVSGNGSKPVFSEPHVLDAGNTDDGFAAPGTFS
jgi:sec-independent protein translocase protein TatA